MCKSSFTPNEQEEVADLRILESYACVRLRDFCIDIGNSSPQRCRGLLQAVVSITAEREHCENQRYERSRIEKNKCDTHDKNRKGDNVIF